MTRLWLAAIGCAAALPAAAQTYGDTLAASVASHHPGIVSLQIAATGKDGKPIAVSHGQGRGVSATAPLANAVGEPIGTVTLVTRRRASAAPIAAELARHIYVADNLKEADPFVAGAARAPHAQALIEAMLARYPDLVTLAMHVAPPGKDNAIIASNFGRIGKAADGDDMDVIAHGTIRREVTNNGHRLAVELPQLDAHGKVIGALSTSFVVGKGGEDAAYARAIALRDELARRTPSLEILTAK